MPHAVRANGCAAANSVGWPWLQSGVCSGTFSFLIPNTVQTSGRCDGMLEKTQAIALRIVPYSRTSLIVHWLSFDHGRVSTLAKGATRPRSDFLGQIDLFYTCEIVYYCHPNSTLHILRECATETDRAGLRGHWHACAAASYLCDLTWRIVQPSHAQKDVFELLSNVLDFMALNEPAHTLLFWFELQLLQGSGLAPQLGQCPVCGQDTSETAGDVWFSLVRGGILCHRCKTGDDPHPIAVAPDTVKIMRAWQEARSPQAALRVRCTQAQKTAIAPVLASFLAYHVDIAPASRTIALQLMNL